jgi:thioredoxin 1
MKEKMHMRKMLALALLAILAFSACSNAADTTAAKAKAKKTKQTKTIAKTAPVKSDSAQTKTVKIPKLVDLGAGKCIPCKMMAPILEELKNEYVGRLEVVFIDVWKNSDEGDKYKIRVIPTQIFFSPEGKELFRHEGFYSREDILAKWKELGYEIKK